MSIQQLLEQLEGMGLSGFGAQSEDIASQLTSQYGLGATPLTGEMFQTISPGLVKGASMSAYSPLFQQKQGAMMTDLMTTLGGGETKKAYGGFAGSGGAQFAQQKARDVYGKGMQDVLTQATGAKSHSLATIQNIIDQWRSTAQSFVGPGMG